MHPLASLEAQNRGNQLSRKQTKRDAIPPQRIDRKYRLLEQRDPEHKGKVEGTFTSHLAAAVRASSPSERQQALDNAIEAYEAALDDAL
jgi:hypothetical protein